MKSRLLLALRICLLLGISGAIPGHLKLLALVNHNGTAAILSTPSSQGGRGGGGGGEMDQGEVQIFPFVGHQVSEACTSSLRSSRCRTLYREDLPDGTMVLAVPLQGAVGLKQLRASGTDLTEEAEFIVTIPYQNCVPLDVISYRDERRGDHFLLVLCLHQKMSGQFLVACDIYIDSLNISRSLVITYQEVGLYPFNRRTFSYDSISNFAYFPERMQLLFTIDNGLEGFHLEHFSAMPYSGIHPGPDCNRLQYIGDHKLNVYCRSGELLQYDINFESLEPSSLANMDGVNFTCSPSLVLNLQQTTDNGTVVSYGGISSNIDGNNLMFAQCYGNRSFLIVDSLEGIKELDINTGLVREIEDSSDFSQVVILEDPRLMVVGLRVDVSSPEVVVYDENIDLVVRWPGSVLAVGVVVLEPQPSTPFTTNASSFTPNSPPISLTSSVVTAVGGAVGVVMIVLAALLCIYVRKRCEQRKGNGDQQGINYMHRLDDCSTEQGSRKELLLHSSKSDIMETNPDEGNRESSSSSSSSSLKLLYTPISTPTLKAKSATPSPSLAVANPNVTSPSPVLSSTPEEASSSTDSIPKLLLAEDQVRSTTCSRQDSGSCEGTTCRPQAAEGSGCGSSLVAGRGQSISPQNLTPALVLENSQQRTETEELRNDLQQKIQLMRQDQLISPPKLTPEVVLENSKKQTETAKICYPTIAKAKIESSLFNSDTNYIDHAVRIFNYDGGVFKFENCTLSIPKGSIPQDKVIAIEIGVTICTELTSLLPRDMTPISPIIQLCVLNEPNFKFAKPVTLQVLHFLDISCDEDAQTMDLHFLKSYHNLPCFHTTDGQEEFLANEHHGTLTIDHFCSFCIAASKTSINATNINYYIMSVMPKEIISRKWDIVYCIVLFTCTRIVEKQYDSADFDIKKVNRFKFNKGHPDEAHIELDFKRELEGGWNLALLLGTKIKASAIDYTKMDLEELKIMEEDKFYPPHFTVQISGTNANKSATLVLTFSGSIDTFTTEVVLEAKPAYLPITQSLPNLSVSHGEQSTVKSWLEQSRSKVVFIGSSPESPLVITEFNFPPTDWELMNHIAVNIPTKWWAIGIQLGLKMPDLETIELKHKTEPERCFSAVFDRWKRKLTAPFTWSTILQALTSPLVDEQSLAQQTRCMLSEKSSTNSSVALTSSEE